MLGKRQSTENPPGPTYMNKDQMNNYLSDLRSNRPARPTGARPPPSSFRSTRHSVAVSPVTAPSEVEAPKPSTQNATINATSRRVSGHRKTSSTSQIPTASKTFQSLGGRPLVQAPTKAADKIEDPVEIAFQENGERLKEKKEARSLRLALEAMDMAEEEKLHADAQKEASELVWKHQNPSAAIQNPHAPYRYNDHQQKRRVSKEGELVQDGVVVRKGRISGSVGAGSRSASGESDSAATTSSTSSRVPSDGSLRIAAGKTGSLRRRSSQFAATIIKKSEETLEAIRPAIRKVSGRKEPNVDQPPKSIERTASEPAGVSSIASKFGSVHARNPFSRVRNARAALIRQESCPTGDVRKPYLERVEIQRNPPSQSRNAGYVATSSRPGTPLESPKPKDENLKLKDGKEIRDDEIRKATSMSLKDRSPRLPTPTMVSDAPGRPIVSFKNDWEPKEVKLKQEISTLPSPTKIETPKVESTGEAHQSPINAVSSATPAPPNRANTFPLLKAPMAPPAQKSYSTPIPSISVSETPSARAVNAPSPPVPTICVSEGPTTRPSARPVPSIAIASAPSISSSLPPSLRIGVPPPPKNIAPPTPTIAVSCPSIAVSPPTISVSSDTNSSSRPLPTPGQARRQRPLWAIPSQSSSRSSVLCNDCAMPISGRIVTAAGVRFHPACFRCYHCSEALECVAFFPEPESKRVKRLADGDPDDGLRFFCHLDYHEFFSPRCKSCKTPIEGDVVVACGAEWHAGHFFCAQCGDPFEATTPFVEKDGYAWCTGCHTNRFSTKCQKCRKPVTDMVVKAVGAEWHESCFCCHECGSKFDDGRYFLREGEEEPVCPGCEEKRLKA